MKNSEKIQAAQKVVTYAKSIGFDNARIQIVDKEDDEIYDTIEDLAADYESWLKAAK